MFNKRTLCLGFLICSAATASAQEQFGVVGGTEGLVTVSEGSTVSSAAVGKAVLDGSRFVTGSNGVLTLQLAGGCSISLRPNQALTVRSNATCAALTASVQSFGSTAVAGGATWPIAAASLMTGALYHVSRSISNK